ncbi:hypothetical protein C8A05DRAFT_39151, partial [Staphylotrichum tortipilum]
MRFSATCAWLLVLRAAAQDVDVADIVLEGVDDGTNYYQQLHPCPLVCDGSPSSEWIMYSSWDRFAVCNEPVLLSFALSNPVLDPDTPTKITTCTAGNANSKVNALFNATDAAALGDTSSPDASSTSSRPVRVKRQPPSTCEAASARASATESKVSLQLSLRGTDPDAGLKRTEAASTALATLHEHFGSGDSPCEENVMFAYHQGVVAGVYIGASFGRATVASVAKVLLGQIQSTTATTVAAQLCGAPDRNARHTFGLVVDVSGNVTAVQEAVRGWNQAKCLTPAHSESLAQLRDVLVVEDKAGLGLFEDMPSWNGTALLRGNGTAPSGPGLARRDECRTIRVEDGDGCASLAARCGIAGKDFM